MRTVNIHEAKTQLSKLVDRAAKGESFVSAKAGKPMVRVVPVDAPISPQRVGFMVGEIAVPPRSPSSRVLSNPRREATVQDVDASISVLDGE